MKRILVAAVVLSALPVVAQAQSSLFAQNYQPTPGVYVGAQGGLNWLLNSNNYNMDLGYSVGGVVGYDFVGPRVELEGMFRSNNGRGTANFGNVFSNTSGRIEQLSAMINVLYDFLPGATITPYVGAGAGIAFADSGINGCSLCSTQFAYQGIVGVGWNIDQNFRVNLDARYYGTTNGGGLQYQNNNITAMLGVTYKFGQPEQVVAPPPAAPVTQAPSYMVFFDWDRSNLSDQALATIQQAANMALSLRRANTVKDALVRNGVPATAIAVIGKGETQLLVQTGDGVREPQNRRVEIVIQ